MTYFIRHMFAGRVVFHYDIESLDAVVEEDRGAVAVLLATDFSPDVAGNDVVCIDGVGKKVAYHLSRPVRSDDIFLYLTKGCMT